MFGGLFVILVPVLMAAWIGVAVLRASTDADAAGRALAMVLAPVLALVVFPLTHRAMCRWIWYVERQRASRGVNGVTPAYGAEPTQPAPRIEWTRRLRARHAVMYALGIAAILHGFLSDPHSGLSHFVLRHSAGTASARTLATLLFAYLPMALLCGVAMLLTARQMRRRDAGTLSPTESRLLSAELIWLFAFAAAFGMTALLGHVVDGWL